MELIKWETCMRSGPNIRSNTIVELEVVMFLYS